MKSALADACLQLQEANASHGNPPLTAWLWQLVLLQVLASFCALGKQYLIGEVKLR